KHTLSEYLKEKESFEKKITILKDEIQKEESQNIDKELALEKEVKELNNIVFKRNQSAQTVHMLTKPQVFYNHATRQALESRSKMIAKQNDPQLIEKKVLEKQLKPKLYEGRIIEKSDAVVILDTEETLMLAEESRSKMIEKQNDPQMTEKKIELSTEQAFWSQYLVQTDEPNLSTTTTIVEVLKELPKVSMELFSSFDQCLIDEVTEIQNVFKQMKLAVEQHHEEKNKCLSKMENVLQENDRPLTQALSVEIVNVVVHDNVKSACFNVDVCAHCLLNNLKGKAVLTEAVYLNPIDPELLKVDVAPLVPKLRKNRTAHTDYIRHTQEEAATLREIVERVILVSSASGSMSQDNTKKNRIRRTQRKAKKNKIEDHLRTVKSSLNKKSVVDLKATSSVINSVSNVNSILKCASLNGCLFSDNHDACVVAYIKYVNASSKSKSVKIPVKRKVWKTTGNVFKTIRHIWRPT
nr:hypothetical protein [Tanacetum cinerariifolium]